MSQTTGPGQHIHSNNAHDTRTGHIAANDPEIADLIGLEAGRQRDSIRMIASENYASKAVLEAGGSILANKYSEGYAGRRYYEGQAHIDDIERIAVKRAKALFGAEAVNVQPYSGTPANLAVYLAFCEPGDPVLGLSLPHGGHLSHGWSVSISGRYFDAHHYTVHPETHLIDMDGVRRAAKACSPKIIWAGHSAYPRTLDFAAFAEIATEVGAVFVADIAHISGLVAGGAHPSPFPHADVVTTTTHKTLRGPRGGMIMCKKAHRKAINSAVFPGVQGGPHNQNTAGLAVALKEASTDAFKDYAKQVVNNAKAFADALLESGYSLVSGGTDNHLVVIDVTRSAALKALHEKEADGVASGKTCAARLSKAGIVCNYNTVPFDPRKPFDPSGIRIGTPATTSRGMTETDMKTIASWIDTVLKAGDDEQCQAATRQEIAEFCKAFPAPGIDC